MDLKNQFEGLHESNLDVDGIRNLLCEALIKNKYRRSPKEELKVVTRNYRTNKQ